MSIEHCLCGKPHPCPDHGQWVHTTYRPTPPVAHKPVFNGFYLLRLLDEATNTIRHHHQKEAM